jgi:nucleoid-associated protein YgaU
MEPAALFLVYVVGLSCAWLLGTVVYPAITAISQVGILVPMARPVAAIVVSLVLAGGVASANASVGPPSERVVRMVDVGVSVGTGDASIVHRPTMASAGSTYTVVKGDSLWRIARSVLSGDGSDPSGTTISDLWRSIYEMNRDLIGEDPDLIHPAQVLQLPGR